MIEKVLAELGSGGKTFKTELDKLVALKVPGNDADWKELYVKACKARREIRLKSLLSTTKKIVFTKHYNMGGSHYAYTEAVSDARHERNFRPNSALCLMEMME